MVWLEFGLFAAALVAGVALFMWWGQRRFEATPGTDDRPSLGMGIVGRWVVAGIGVVIFIVGLATSSPAGILGGLTLVVAAIGEQWVYRNNRRR